ncbi:MAG: Rpp14/Pop5 family protein [Candidatus Bathyarchaeia archaeon]|nr:Rpp14/Pop5 family protein [Candidatus Bathyarchaeota archaeon]
MLEKPRRRYILIKIDCDGVPGERDFQNALWSGIMRLFGEYGASQTDISMIEYNRDAGYAIVRCQHKALPMVRAAIPTITKVGDKSVVLHVLLTSGTLKALRKGVQKYLYTRCK